MAHYSSRVLNRGSADASADGKLVLNRPRTARTAQREFRAGTSVLAFCIVFVALLLIPAAVLADNYVGGLQLTTVQSGTVTGDLWMDIAPAPNWGGQDATKTFTLPAAAVAEPGRITWARLYVSAYCSHMQNDVAFTMTTSFDGDGVSGYEQIWPETAHGPFHYQVNQGDGFIGNDNSGFAGHGSHEPYLMLNDHETRVTSDYFAWYDVTDMISSQEVTVNVNTVGSGDGRIKVMSLVVAYDDPSSTTQTTYWVNQGHDVCSYYTENAFGTAAVGTTTFATTGLTGINSATLTVDYMASNNGYYGFPTSANTFTFTGGTPPITGTFTNVALDRDPDMQGSYSGVDSWDVTSSVTGAGDVTFAYSRYFPAAGTAAFFKIPLAFLVVKSPTVAPVANFTGTPTSGIAPLTVTFTDASTNYPQSWLWDFGDGDTSTVQNPVHTYASAGTYTVNLTATNFIGSGTETKAGYITVDSAITPEAAFSATPTSGTAPLIVQFTDTSTNSPTSWFWDFGDGSTSTLQNPSNTYTTPGTYTVNLTVTNAGGSGNETKTDYITVSPTVAPVADFGADKTSGSTPLTVQFTDASANTPTQWAWTFGDGATSSAQNPVHTYTTAGTYTVKLTASNTAGSDIAEKTGYINVTAVTNGGLATTAWPKFGQNAGNTGLSPFTGPQSANLVWTYDASADLSWSSFTYAGASVGSDGTVYVGNNNGYIYAFNPDGTLKWKYSTGSGGMYTTTYGTPAIAADGTIYAGNYAGKLYALNPDGTLKWIYTTGGMGGSPSIGTDGTIYVASSDYNLYAVNPDGTLKWTYTAGNSFRYTNAPAIGSDGTIYVGNSGDHKLYAINSDGTLKWAYDTGKAIYGAPAVGSDDTIYICSEEYFNAVTNTGTLKWRTDLGTYNEPFFRDTPAIGPDGTVYAGNRNKNLYAFNPDGTSKWIYTTGGLINYGSPVVGSDSTIYIGTQDSKIYAIQDAGTAGTLKWSYTTGNYINGIAAIASDGTLYIGSQDQKFYAFRDVMPVAAFSANVTSGTNPLAVAFTDESANTPTSWLWDFGDGATSTEQSPSHTYTAVGTYTVTLTVTNPVGSDCEVKQDLISVTLVFALPGQANLPTDPDSDGLFEDLNGNGVKDTNDVVLFFKNLNWMKLNEPIAFFDFNHNGALDTNDVVLLFKKKMT